MKEISFEIIESGSKEPTKYTIKCEQENSVLIIQKGPESSKMGLSVACARKLMEAMEYIIKG